MREIRRSILRTILAALLLAVLAGLLAVAGHRELTRPTGRSLEGPGTLLVPRGASLRTVSEALADSGWVRHPRLLAWWGALIGIDRGIQAGRYRIEEGWSPLRLLEEIGAGRVERSRITIPEGWREEQILRLLADSLEIDEAGLRGAARDTAWMEAVGVPDGRLEGYLFPETYHFPKSYDPVEVLAVMARTADRRFDEAMRLRAASIGMSREEAVILASIIQAEAAREGEMPRISGVFHNRLRNGWKLEADPTVLYALGRFTAPVLNKDLEVSSPYNTYQAQGLPPGAIGNPGAAALRAALWPDSTRGEFYFVAKGDGGHLFSRTLAEHNRARRLVRASMGGR